MSLREQLLEVRVDIVEEEEERRCSGGGGLKRSSKKVSPLEKRNSLANALRRAGQLSQELKKQFSPSPRIPRGLPSPSRVAIQGLRFITSGYSSSSSSISSSKQWREVEARFDKLARNGLLRRADFGACIGMQESQQFATRIFDALARRRRLRLRRIDKAELKEFWLQITDQSFDSRMQLFFDLCDTNADGLISQEEVKEVIMLSASENKLSKLKEHAEEYAAMIMEELDPIGRGYIELWQLRTLLNGDTQELRNPSHQQQKPATKKMTKQFIYIFIEHWRRVWVLALWFVAMAALFCWKFMQYRRESSFLVLGYCVCVAKGAAETLKLNMALVLFPVCRNSITWLRSTRLASLVPFDDNLNFHKIIAGAIVAGVVLHAGFHLGCDFPRLVSSRERHSSLVSQVFHRQPAYWDLVKSVEGVTGIGMVLLMSVAFVLASRWFRRNLIKLPGPLQRVTGFNAFWYSHHLFVIVYVMLVIHSMFLFLKHAWIEKTTWMYLALPLLLYSVERTYSGFRAGYYTVQIFKAAVYQGDVLALHMTKPPGFKYDSGMYIFIKCPSISPFEWHPFSITSSPSDDYVSVHIRTSGDWTSALGEVFSAVCEPPVGNMSGLLRAEAVCGQISTKSRFPKLLIDGPYGAPAQDYKKYDVLLLIGLGIGATPFISILKDILNDQQQRRKHGLQESTNKPVGRKKHQQGPTNAYFYWLTREQGSFDWFKGIMNEIAELDHSAVIEMHNYLTSVYAEDDARSALIRMVQTLHHEKNGVDVLSGTRVRTHFAKPNWRRVFTELSTTHPNARIGVFYCGSILLARELDALAGEFSQEKTTKFDFHKENF